MVCGKHVDDDVQRSKQETSFRILLALLTTMQQGLWQLRNEVAMPTTVYFGTNRKLTGDPSLVASYGADIQSADDPSGLERDDFKLMHSLSS